MNFDSQTFLIYGVFPSVVAAGVTGGIVWIIAWFFGRWRLLKQLKLNVQNLVDSTNDGIKRIDSGIESVSNVSERAESIIRAGQLSIEKVENLAKSVVQFPDTSRFKCIGGVYFYIGTDGVHPNDSPLCPICLIERHIPIQIQQVPIQRVTMKCGKCDFYTGWHALDHAMKEAGLKK